MKPYHPISKFFVIFVSVFSLANCWSGNIFAQNKTQLSADYKSNLNIKVPGLEIRKITVDGKERSYLVHIPPNLAAQKTAVPVVLAYHGAMTNGMIMAALTGLNEKADTSKFVVVYPNGTGANDINLYFNAFQTHAESKAVDDVAFTSKLLDDLGTVVNIDTKRIFATGMSNGGMMCYKLAAELSDRIAAIAPVAGTMAIDITTAKPKRAIPIIHFHGTSDHIVKYDGDNNAAFNFAGIKSVDETIDAWVRIDGIQPAAPKTTPLPVKVEDGTHISRIDYGSGKNKSEIVLYKIENGGHTWPGRPMPVVKLGLSTSNISANDLMWDFFVKHPKSD